MVSVFSQGLRGTLTAAWIRSRSDLVAQLIGDVCQYHGYTPYLAEKLFDLFGVDEVCSTLALLGRGC